MPSAELKFSQITSASTVCFDGAFKVDTDNLDQNFYPDNRLNFRIDEMLFAVNKKDYLGVVLGRKSPNSFGAKRYEEIISINMAGPGPAVAKVECTIPPRNPTDLLTMIKLDGQ